MYSADKYIYAVCPYIIMPKGYNASRNKCSFHGYHFVWCPKYRRKVLVGNVEKRLKELIKEKAKTMECEVLALEIMPDYVHLFIVGSPIMTPNYIIGQIKGFTSHQLREEFPDPTPQPSYLMDKELFRFNAWTYLRCAHKEIHR